MHLAILLAALILADKPDTGNSRSTPAAELARFTRMYDIDISFTDLVFPIETAGGQIDGKEADEDELGRFVQLLVREFSLYPPEIVKRCKLKRIVLCKELSLAKQRATGFTDVEHRTIYFDASLLHPWSWRFTCRLVHHELFHAIDYRNDNWPSDHDRWKSLNPNGFKYGKGGMSAQNNPHSSVFSDAVPGFLNHYSTSAVGEDRAEVFATLVVESTYVAYRIKQDAVLRAKVRRMKELAAGFCPDLKDAFWEKAKKVDRSPLTSVPLRTLSPDNTWSPSHDRRAARGIPIVWHDSTWQYANVA